MSPNEESLQEHPAEAEPHREMLSQVQTQQHIEATEAFVRDWTRLSAKVGVVHTVPIFPMYGMQEAWEGGGLHPRHQRATEAR